MAYKYISPQTIEKIADDIRRDLLPSSDGCDVVEVDIFQIAKGLGCSIETVEFDPSNISARVVRDLSLQSKYTIQISRKDTFKRQKFSIAHEIAHIILHDDGKDEFIELRQGAVDYAPEELYKEVQANMLAAALLLPYEKIKRLWEVSKSVDDVAEVFNVSKEAACNRLANLGFLENE